jgi:hypothetical protein
MILPHKGATVAPITKCDETWSRLANDKSITDIPSGSQFGSAPQTQRVVTQAEVQGELIKSSGGAMNQGSTNLVENTNVDWINSKWRPAMGWAYMVMCICDFTLFPILWSLLQVFSHGAVQTQWQPLTIQGGGLFHIAFGACIGVAAYGRSQEKMAGKQ